MMRHLLFVSLALVVVVAADVTAQGASGARVDPKLTAKLREDLATAIANANLSDEQQRTLETARETLRTTSEARQAGKSIDRDEVKQAFADIKKVLDSDAFRPEDTKRVREDMEAIQKAMREQMKGRFGRRRPAVA